MEQRAASHRLPPELPQDLIEEILLRFPPDEVASLVAVSLVSRTWSQSVWSHSFARRYRALHWTDPALVGFFQNLRFCDNRDYIHRFVRAVCNNSPLVQPELDVLDSQQVDFFLSPNREFGQQPPNEPAPAPKRVLDCRHGMALLRVPIPDSEDLFTLTVWEPVTNSQYLLPDVPFKFDPEYISGAVLCSLPDCDHRSCRLQGLQKGFQVIFVGASYCEHDSFTRLSIFSSESGGWTPATTLRSEPKNSFSLQEVGPSRLVGGSIFFFPDGGQRILRYDLALGHVSWLFPPRDLQLAHLDKMMLVVGEDGGLGLVTIVDLDIQIWSHGGYGWFMEDTISLLPLRHYPRTKSGKLTIGSMDHRGFTLLGFAEVTGELFVSSAYSISMIDLEESIRTGLMKKKLLYSNGTHCPVFPYVRY